MTLRCSEKSPLTFVFRSRHPDYFQHLGEEPSPSGSVSCRLCGGHPLDRALVNSFLEIHAQSQGVCAHARAHARTCRKHMERDRRTYLAFCIISKKVHYRRVLLFRSAVMKGTGGRGGDVFEHDADSHTTIFLERADIISKVVSF